MPIEDAVQRYGKTRDGREKNTQTLKIGDLRVSHTLPVVLRVWTRLANAHNINSSLKFGGRPKTTETRNPPWFIFHSAILRKVSFKEPFSVLQQNSAELI